jgi:hypothetical protein
MSPEEVAEEAEERAWLAQLDQASRGPFRLSTAGAMRTEAAVDPASQSGYDWRMNQQDWRFRVLSTVPFGLLFIAVSLQRKGATEAAVDPAGQSGYDWRTNQQDWRFRVLSTVPFGLPFIAVSLQRKPRAELASPGPAVAMVSVRGQGQQGQQSRPSRPRQTLAEWICM